MDPITFEDPTVQVSYNGNGTAWMVKDINTGSDWGACQGCANLMVIGNMMYFTAETNANGRELWRTDGTEAGTVMVKDINSGSDHGYVHTGRPVAIGNTLYFSADDGTNGEELWESDGTEAGTVLVKDIRNGSYGGNPRHLTVIGNTLYFTGDEGHVLVGVKKRHNRLFLEPIQQ